MQHFDAIVVGLGAMGSAATYQLARSNRAVLGIDRLSPPHGQGSSHGETKIIRQATGEGAAYVPFALRSHELWRELEAESATRLVHDVGVAVITPTAAGGGSMHGTQDFAGTTIDLARRHHIEHEVLRHDELARRLPQLRLSEECVGYYEPGAGYVRSDEVIRTQLTMAERHGAAVRRDEEVVAVEPSNAGVVVQTDRDRYGAEVAVVAAGAWLPELLEPRLAALFTVYRQINVWFGTDVPAAFAPAVLPVFIWQFGTGGADVFYGIPAIDGPAGGVKIGTETYAHPTDARSPSRTVEAAEAAQIYERCLRGRVPGLGPDVVRGTGCLYTVTPDYGFVVDRHPEHENVIIASPCSGHGFKHSAAIGEALAQLATTGRSTLDVQPFALDRFAVLTRARAVRSGRP